MATYLCGVSTLNVELALAEALGAGVSKSSVSRALASLRPQFEAWKRRDLTDLKVKRLILDGFGVPVRMDGKSHRLTTLVAIGIRDDGTKEVLALHAMASESKEAWLQILEDLSSRGVKDLDLVVGDGSKGLEAAISEVWANVLVQRCTVHKERNLLTHAPEAMHEELKAEYSQMMYADTADQALELRRTFVNKWRAKCPGVARSLEEAGDRLFTFLRFPPSQWKGIRTTNAIERLNEEFRRRVKVQGLEPNGDSVCMLFWALLASGKVVMRKAVGYESLNQPVREELKLAASMETVVKCRREAAPISTNFGTRPSVALRMSIFETRQNSTGVDRAFSTSTPLMRRPNNVEKSVALVTTDRIPRRWPQPKLGDRRYLPEERRREAI